MEEYIKRLKYYTDKLEKVADTLTVSKENIELFSAIAGLIGYLEGIKYFKRGDN